MWNQKDKTKGRTQREGLWLDKESSIISIFFCVCISWWKLWEGGWGVGYCDTLYVMHVCKIFQYIIHNIQYIVSPQTSFTAVACASKYNDTRFRLSIRLIACTRKRWSVRIWRKYLSKFRIFSICYISRTGKKEKRSQYTFYCSVFSAGWYTNLEKLIYIEYLNTLSMYISRMFWAEAPTVLWCE